MNSITGMSVPVSMNILQTTEVRFPICLSLYLKLHALNFSRCNTDTALNSQKKTLNVTKH